MLCLDGDGKTGREFIGSLCLPEHFAIRSRRTGGTKHVGYVPGGVPSPRQQVGKKACQPR
jgi:hypothetical protein